MPVIRLRPQAEHDLLDIWVSIAEHSPSAADRVSDLLAHKFQILADQPLAGPARDELAQGLRMFPAEDFLIFYRPIEDGIDIIRVLHSARDLPSLF